MSTHVSEPDPLDRITSRTRVVAALVISVLVPAFVILYLFPGDTERLFAWPIGPRMTAMMLGGAYLGGAYFFARVVVGRSWNAVRLGFLPVTAFATTMALATLLHWDRFTEGHVSFYVWTVVYFITPFLVPATWYLNRRVTARGDDVGPTLPARLRLAYGGLGAVFLVATVMLFFFPQTMIEIWPWTLSPLTSRVMAAMSVLAGGMAVSIAVDRRWEAARIPLQTQAFTVSLFLLAMAVARHDIAWARAGSWLMLAFLLSILGLITVTVAMFRSSGIAQTAVEVR
jgi:hypothetical protein